MKPSNTHNANGMAFDGRNFLNLAIDQYHVHTASAWAYPAYAGHCFLGHLDPPKPDKPENADGFNLYGQTIKLPCGLLVYFGFVLVADGHLFDGIYCLSVIPVTEFHITKRHINAEEEMVRPEEGVAAHESGCVPVERGIRVKHFVIVDGSFGEPLKVFLSPAHLSQILKLYYPLCKVGHHAAAMVCDKLQVGVFLQYAAENQAGHGSGGLINPAERVVYSVLRFGLRPVVRIVRISHRVDHYRQIILRHLLVQRYELGRVKRLVSDGCIHENAP